MKAEFRQQFPARQKMLDQRQPERRGQVAGGMRQLAPWLSQASPAGVPGPWTAGNSNQALAGQHLRGTIRPGRTGAAPRARFNSATIASSSAAASLTVTVALMAGVRYLSQVAEQRITGHSSGMAPAHRAWRGGSGNCRKISAARVASHCSCASAT